MFTIIVFAVLAGLAAVAAAAAVNPGKGARAADERARANAFAASMLTRD